MQSYIYRDVNYLHIFEIRTSRFSMIIHCQEFMSHKKNFKNCIKFIDIYR